VPKQITYAMALTLTLLLWSSGVWAPPGMGGARPPGMRPPVIDEPYREPLIRPGNGVERGAEGSSPDGDVHNRLRTKRHDSPYTIVMFYDGKFAIRLFDIGFNEREARKLAEGVVGEELRNLWEEEHRANPNTKDTIESIKALKHKAEGIIRDREIKKKTATIKAKAEPYEEAYKNAKTLAPEIVEGLKSASLGRKILLSPSMPNVFLRATDNPAHDRALIEHVWYVKAMALHYPVPAERLHLIDLFARSELGEPAGDAAEPRVQALLSGIRATQEQELTADQVEAIQALRRALVGEDAFDKEFLVSRLKALEGHSIFVLGHIPEATVQKGAFEPKYRTESPVATRTRRGGPAD
jgi:hypothetical protein